MNALSTMLLISDAFVELCDEMPLRKVSISDIVERTGKNRKTFYYHFENKDRLIIWIFRYDMGQCLKQHFSESVLLYDDNPEDPTSRFPYYITQKSGVRSLDHAEFSSASPRCWRDAATSTARRSWTTAPTRCATTCTRCIWRP